jgi:hypothetical protein
VNDRPNADAVVVVVSILVVLLLAAWPKSEAYWQWAQENPESIGECLR